MSDTIEAARIVWRGFLIVMLTASNVAQISGGHYVGAFLNGAAISFVWWTNSRTASLSNIPRARELYALGAGLGTVAGMLLVENLYR